MTNLLDVLANRAIQALQAYEKGVAKQKMGHADTINAVIEYGQALLEGRSAHASDKEFGKWIEDNGLDDTKPFERRQERTAAMQIAKIVTDGSIPVSNLFNCANTCPVDIMKWTRLQSWFVAKESKPQLAKPPKRTVRGRPRKDEPPRLSLVELPSKLPKFATVEEHRKWVDPEFVGTGREFVDLYGHVQTMTAEQYATMRFTAWAINMRAIAKAAKELPDWPRVDHNWLRSPEPRFVAKMAEALERLRPLMREAEALLARAREAQPAQDCLQPTDGPLQTA
jgi:hypothetical protein